MTLSILHRVTGVGLSVGFVVLAAWLFCAASGAEAYTGFIAMLGTVVGKVLLVGWSFAFFFHLSNGIRHLVWDFGHGFEISQANASAWFVLLASVAMTGLFWWLQL
jgi:succinate dehydrogenase / fumarate reductase cytochrome b subunit